MTCLSYAKSSGSDPIKHSCIEFYSTLENWPIREAKMRHMTDLIGQFQHWIKLYAGILFIGIGPGVYYFLEVLSGILYIFIFLAARERNKRCDQKYRVVEADNYSLIPIFYRNSIIAASKRKDFVLVRSSGPRPASSGRPPADRSSAPSCQWSELVSQLLSPAPPTSS